MVQEFGGAWTLIKLDVISKYLQFYTTALGKKFKLCYIDAFAGSGEIRVRDIGQIPGSAIRALDPPFDKYVFVEKKPTYSDLLRLRLSKYSACSKATIIEEDCNNYLTHITSASWFSCAWRGVIFLDPYSLQVKWQTLIEIAKTRAFDIWYLFPLMGLNRLLRRDKDIPVGHRAIIDKVLGTTTWEDEIYRLSPQMSFWGDEFEKNNIDSMKNYVLQRLSSVFPAVSPKALVLRTVKTNSPLYLLCFATSNPAEGAMRLALRGANYILTHV
jgi:three-Cys-motif partner protein